MTFNYNCGWLFRKTIAPLFVRFFFSMTFAVSLFAQDSGCDPDPQWLPVTPMPSFDGPPPPHPAPDCPFYTASWQTFLFATQPDDNGNPAFLNYPTIEQTFGSAATKFFSLNRPGFLSLAPRTIQTPNGPHTFGAGAAQAGSLQGLLIDQAGNPVFYAIHMNSVFAQFLRTNGLTTPQGASNAPPNLVYPTGAVELKSAWQVVNDASPPTNFFTVRALVPHLKLVDGQLVVDKVTPPREVTVALLAIHVVFVLRGHPEFIWSSFEHIDPNANPDTAPSANVNPPAITGDPVISTNTFTLYKAGTTYSNGNILANTNDLLASFDEPSQSFTKNGQRLQTSIFRLFPASKATDTNLDDEVVSINSKMHQLFATEKFGSQTDKRRFYQLVGAVWLDKPAKDFTFGKAFHNLPGQSSDDTNAVVAGEDRMSSTAMESFTQSESFSPNCFSCHNTQFVTSNDGSTIVLRAKNLNVSHVISRFLLEGR
jgi:hypothetical protein